MTMHDFFQNFVPEMCIFLFKMAEAILEPALRTHIYHRCVDSRDIVGEGSSSEDLIEEGEAEAAMTLLTYRIICNSGALAVLCWYAFFRKCSTRRLPVLLTSGGSSVAVVALLCGLIYPGQFFQRYHGISNSLYDNRLNPRNITPPVVSGFNKQTHAIFGSKRRMIRGLEDNVRQAKLTLTSSDTSEHGNTRVVPESMITNPNTTSAVSQHYSPQLQHRWWVVCLLISAFIRGITGKSATISMALHSHVADHTSTDLRTQRFGRLLAMNFFGYTIGCLISGGVVQLTGSYGAVFSCVLMAYGSVSLVAYFGLHDSPGLDNCAIPKDDGQLSNDGSIDAGRKIDLTSSKTSKNKVLPMRKKSFTKLSDIAEVKAKLASANESSYLRKSEMTSDDMNDKKSSQMVIKRALIICLFAIGYQQVSIK